MTWPATETELAAAVVQWLCDDDWCVYQEVDAGRIADIVATRGPLLWVIECKLSLSLDVMDQAWRWRRFANLSSCAIPKRRRRPTEFAHHALSCEGIGLLIVRQNASVVENIPPALNRRPLDRLRRRLCDEQKTYAAAGRADGKRWTPFVATCDRLRRYVAGHPGTSMKAAVDSIETHYASSSTARASLTHWLDNGKVPGVRCERDGRLLRLYAEEVRR